MYSSFIVNFKKKTKPIWSLQKYKKILNLINKYQFNKFDLITNFGLFAGDTNVFKTLTLKEIIDKTKEVKGDVVEFGVWRGNTSLLIKKILDIYNIKKKLLLFDHFKGLDLFSKKDSTKKKNNDNEKNYVGEKKILKAFINFYKFKNIKIYDFDLIKLKKKFFKKEISLAIVDVDLYQPTIKILNAVHQKLSKNGIILFDEGNDKVYPGENKALNEFLKKYRIYYKFHYIKHARQPDVYIQKIR